MVCDVDAECPDESTTYTVIVCVPVSFVPGVHEKYPDEFIAELGRLEPLNESETVYVGLLNPEADA
jgi:hypothetical protein